MTQADHPYPNVNPSAGPGHVCSLSVIIGTQPAVQVKAGDSIEVRVTDSGCGIPEHLQSRIFDPFFTTKPVGKGTGQGLAIAHAVIVQKHHGAIRCESQPGRGATFVIQLPLAGELAAV